MKIKFKLSIVFVLMIVVPVVVTSYYFLQANTKYIKGNVYEANLKVAENFDKQINTLIENSISYMRLLSHLPQVKEMDPAVMNAPLQDAVGDYGLISQIYVMDKTGMQIYKTSGSLGDRSDRDYFQKAIQGEENFSDVIVSRSTSESIIVIAIPVKNGDDTVGVVGASLDLTVLSKYMREVKLGEDGYAFIVEGNGKIIAHPDNQKVFEMEDVSALLPVQNVMQGETGYTEYTYEGVNKLAAYVPVEKTGWGVLVQLPAAEAFKEIEVQKGRVARILLITVLCGLVLSYAIGTYITNPLLKIVDKMGRAAKGDLQAKVEGRLLKSGDEFGLVTKSFNAMVAANKESIEKIRVSSEELMDSSRNLTEIVEQNNSAMEQISAGINQLSSAAMLNAEEAGKGNRAVEQVAGGADEIAKNAEKLNKVVLNTVHVAREGAEMMNSTARAIDTAAQEANEIEVKMKSLEEAADEIGNFLGSIINIADQTNLLALNAAIEAARAGESGRGFAVVADEIRKLAEESNSSAEQITTLVEKIKKEVESTAGVYKHTNHNLHEVVDKTNITKDKIAQIVRDADNALAAVEEIAAISEEQATALEEVAGMTAGLLNSITDTAGTTEEMNAGTEEQTASLEQISSLAQELSAMAARLREGIGYYKI
ncbi:MAG: methyl-accepting chemotaxis protein [Peptococcaceae bacterium]